MKTAALWWRLWVRVNWVICFGLVAQTANAQVLLDSLVIGQRDDLFQRELSLPAGQYTITVADALASTPQQLASAQLFLVSGDKRLASVDLTRLTATFTLTDTAAAQLYVAGKPSGNLALLQTRLERAGTSEPVLDEPFLFEVDNNRPRTYYHEQSIAVNSAAPVTFELTDFSASGTLPVEPFTSILVLISNRDSSGHIRQNLYWDVATQPGGPVLNHEFLPVPGTLFVQIIGSAPASGISQLGWKLVQGSNELASDLAQIDDDSTVPGKLIGEFNLAASGSVKAEITSLADSLDDFSLVIASASGGFIELDQSDLTREQTLAKGHYRVLLLTGEASEGLLGVRVQAGATQLLDTSASLGDYKQVGDLTLATGDTFTAGLHFFQLPAGLSEFELRLANGKQAPVLLSAATPTQTNTSLAAGHYRLWEKSNSVTSDGYYRAHLLRGTAVAGQWWGTLGGGFVDASNFSLTSAAAASLSVLNLKLPDTLSDSARLFLTQGDTLLAEYEIDPNDVTKTIANLPLPAGDLQLAIFGHQDAGKASVLGYKLDIAEPATPSTPPRGANGSRKGGDGGGSLGSFFLYSLLVLKIMRRRFA